MRKLLFLLLCTVSMYGQAEFDAGIQITGGQTTTSTSNKLLSQEADGVVNYIPALSLPLSTVNISALQKKADLSTGLIKNGLITINADPTKYNISAGIGIISNFDDPENPVSTLVSFSATTGKTPTYLNTGNITYVAINSAGVIVESASQFTVTQRRDLIILGAVIHSNLTSINVVNNISAPTNAVGNQLHDFMEAIGALNITGNKYTANGANLQLNKSAGSIFKFGVNFATNWKDPHELSQGAETSLTFRYRIQNGTEGSDRINLDPALYDLGNILTAVPNNKFTIQTVTMFQTGLTRIQYGQNVYDDLASAQNAIFTREFVVENNIAMNGVTRAYIILKNTTTSLQNTTDARIVEAQKFGGVASGGVALTFANIVTALGYTPDNVANKQNSLVVDGSGVKYPTVDAVNNEVILQNETPQTKIGSLTLGENLTKTLDNWIALGTSITQQGMYTAPMSKQLGLILNNFGVSGSTSNDIATQYTNIPTLTIGNIDSYRLLTIEYGINDVVLGVPLATYRTNLENAILHAKGKGWANNKILIINSNYCTLATLDPELEPYADEAILISKEQGVQYVDIYNYTKNNGGGSLLSDGTHLTAAGGLVYARGVTSLMNGGLEVDNALNVINGIIGRSVKTYEDSEINGLNIGKGLGNVSTNTALGFESLFTNTSGALNVGIGYRSLKLNTTGLSNTAIGSQALTSNSTGGSNVAVGDRALTANTTAGDNTAIGYQSLLTNTTGARNTAVGNKALLTNLGGNDNTGIGHQSLDSNTSGIRNVGVGALSLGDNNTGLNNVGVGYESLNKNTTGARNTALGYQSLFSNIISSDNTAVGQNAGSFFNINSPLTNAGTSIFIGASSRALADNGSNEIVIGYNVAGLGSNTSSIGNTSTTSARLFGSINLPTTPTTSAGTYDFLTRNASTGIVEKVTSASVAPTASPTFTGTPTAPTATAGTNTTQIATTAFVTSAVGTAAKWTQTGNDIRNSNSGDVEIKPLATLSVLNASNVKVATVSITGQVIAPSFVAAPVVGASGQAGMFGVENGSFLRFDSWNGNNSTPAFNFNALYGNFTTGTTTLINFSPTWNPTSGTSVFNGFNLSPVINQTGGANGITRSLYINPTLTAATDFRAIEVTAGKSMFQEVIANNVVRLKNYTVATLPTGVQGDTAYVTDATAPTYLGALTGGGSVVTPVFYNGTIWVSH